MPTTTKVLALQRMSEQITDWATYTTTSAGAAAGASLISTGLAAGGADDDFCINWWVRISSTTAGSPPVGEIRQVKSYTASTNTIVPVNAFSLQVATAMTFELHRINPTHKLNALNRAVVDAYPNLYLSIRDESLVLDNILSNADMETFA